MPEAESLIILMQDGVAWRSRDFGIVRAPTRSGADRVISTGELLWIEDATLDPAPALTNTIVTGRPSCAPGSPHRSGSRTARRPACFLRRSAGSPQPFDADKAARLAGPGRLRRRRVGAGQGGAGQAQDRAGARHGRDALLRPGRDDADLAGDDRYVAAGDRRQPRLARRPWPRKTPIVGRTAGQPGRRSTSRIRTAASGRWRASGRRRRWLRRPGRLDGSGCRPRSTSGSTLVAGPAAS